MSDFNGFSPELISFLSDLSTHNSRDWFEANRARYEAHYLAPARSFVVAMGERLRPLMPDVRAEPKINGSIRRINRDTRFSADKRPYKDHLDLFFPEDDGPRTPGSGFYLRVTAAGIGYGVGVHAFDKPSMARYRQLVLADGDALASALGGATGGGYAVRGERYARVPRGLPKDHPHAELLKHKGLFAAREQEPPAELYAAEFVDFCEARLQELLPLHRWMDQLRGE